MTEKQKQEHNLSAAQELKAIVKQLTEAEKTMWSVASQATDMLELTQRKSSGTPGTEVICSECLGAQEDQRTPGECESCGGTTATIDMTMAFMATRIQDELAELEDLNALQALQAVAALADLVEALLPYAIEPTITLQMVDYIAGGSAE